MMGQRNNSNAAALTTIAAISAIALLGLIWVVWRMRLSLEIDPNEPWNAWWADAAFSATGLYPDPQALIANNYPPLYFVLLHIVSGLIGSSAIDAGRAVSLLAVLAISTGLWVLLRRFGKLPNLAAGGAALWLLALHVTYFSRYAGMNDPQFIAIAVMLAGLVLVLGWQESIAMLLAGTALMVTAGFIKHSLWAMPVSLLIYLLWTNPRRALLFALAGAVLAATGLAICIAVWGNNFVQQLLLPRHSSWAAAVGYLVGLSWFLVAAVLFLWSSRGAWHENSTTFTGIFLIIALLVDIMQRRGDGVDINAEMELALASAMAIGFAFHKLLSSAALPGVAKGIVTAAMLAPLVIAFPLQALNLYNPDWRIDVLARNASFIAEQKRIGEINNPVACMPASLCYRAGKANVLDYFITSQRVKTGTWPQSELDAKIAAAGITFEKPEAALAW